VKSSYLTLTTKKIMRRNPMDCNEVNILKKSRKMKEDLTSELKGKVSQEESKF